jgi:hypothetical protein
MRESLQKAEGRRTVFFGTVARFGSKPGYKGRAPIDTLLLRDVRDRSGSIYCDHLWFILTTSFQRLDLDLGDRLMFDARVRPYRKGYRGRDDDEEFGVSLDYKLAHPTNVRVIRRADSVAIVQPALFEKAEEAQ